MSRLAKAVLALLAASVGVLPAAAAARADEYPPAAHDAAVDRTAPRLRFDVAGGFAAGSAQSSRVSAAAVVPTLVVDLGVQLGDRWALFGHATGGSALAWNLGGAYLVGEWTPLRWISVGTGVGYASWNSWNLCGCDAQRSEWSGISVPLLIGFNLGGGRREAATRRAALRLGLEGVGGYDASTETAGWHGGLAFGGAWM
jgi:hypothetical protein